MLGLLDDLDQIVVHVLQVLLGVVDDLVETIDGVGRDQGVCYHALDGLASLMKVDLLEKFKSSLKHLVDLIVRLEAVRDVIVNDHGTLYDSFKLHARIINSCVL